MTEYIFDSKPAWLLQDIQEFRNIRDIRFAKILRMNPDNEERESSTRKTPGEIDFDRQRKIKADLSQMYKNFQVEKEGSSIRICFDPDLSSFKEVRKRERLTQLARKVLSTDEFVDGLQTTRSRLSKTTSPTSPRDTPRFSPAPPKANKASKRFTIDAHSSSSSPQSLHRRLVESSVITSGSEWSFTSLLGTKTNEREELFVKIVSICAAARAMRERYDFAKRLQFYSAHLKEILVIQHAVRSWKPVKKIAKFQNSFFTLILRIRRKKMASDKLLTFLREAKRWTGTLVVKRFLQRVKVCQRAIRGFLVVHRNRGLCAGLLWERVELAVRKAADERAAMASRRKARKKSRQVVPPQWVDFNKQWEAVHSQVRKCDFLNSSVVFPRVTLSLYTKYCRLPSSSSKLTGA